MTFVCEQCGECCRHIDKIKELRDYDKGNGICKFLIDSKCSIYNHRPDICNVDAMYEQTFKFWMSREKYYELNHAGCMELMKSMDKRKDRT